MSSPGGVHVEQTRALVRVTRRESWREQVPVTPPIQAYQVCLCVSVYVTSVGKAAGCLPQCRSPAVVWYAKGLQPCCPQDHLERLAANDPVLLLAHSYTQHLALLSGGQIIKVGAH